MSALLRLCARSALILTVCTTLCATVPVLRLHSTAVDHVWVVLATVILVLHLQSVHSVAVLMVSITLHATLPVLMELLIAVEYVLLVIQNASPVLSLQLLAQFVQILVLIKPI